MSEQGPEALWIPLHGLYYVDDPKAFPVPVEADREALVAAYTPERILAIFDALTWALAHPDFPFLTSYAQYIPDMDHDNATIVEDFKKLREGMKPVVDKLRAQTSTR
jgi:hypothetical protein